MPRNLPLQSTETPLEQVLQQLALLDRAQLKQLQNHLAELLSLLPALPTEVPAQTRLMKELPAEVAQRHAANQTEPLRGSRGGGGIEWKLIRQGNKVYGPYPYWRFNVGKSRRSLYLKQLAQEQRQSQSIHLTSISTLDS